MTDATFAQEVLTARRGRDWSLADVARAADLPQEVVRGAEQGDAVPRDAERSIRSALDIVAAPAPSADGLAVISDGLDATQSATLALVIRKGGTMTGILCASDAGAIDAEVRRLRDARPGWRRALGPTSAAVAVASTAGLFADALLAVAGHGSVGALEGCLAVTVMGATACTWSEVPAGAAVAGSDDERIRRRAYLLSSEGLARMEVTEGHVTRTDAFASTVSVRGVTSEGEGHLTLTLLVGTLEVVLPWLPRSPGLVGVVAGWRGGAAALGGAPRPD